MARDVTALDNIRHLLRIGCAGAAAELLPASEKQDADMKVEAALLALLRFENAGRIETELAALDLPQTDAGQTPRYHLARGITANRQRDPLAALSWFRKGLEQARHAEAPAETCELLLERAKVHVWMGGFTRAHEDLAEAMTLTGQAPNLRLQTYFRYADLYTESEQPERAKRFVDLGLSEAKSVTQSIYAWQLHLIALAIALSEKKQAPHALSRLEQDQDHFPAYLQFRFAAIAARHAMLAKDITRSAAMMKMAEAHAGKVEPDSFEAATLAGLRGQHALLSAADHPAAVPELREALEWHEKRELAVPSVRLAMLLAEALLGHKKRDEAAGLVTRWRDYCGRRGLQVQREALEVFQQDNSLPRMAEIEQSHAATEKLWNVARAYVLQGPLGQGGQGTVYAAHDTVRDLPVAFKKLALPPGPDAFEALRHEVQALCAAQVPGVARIIACGTAEDGLVYLVQEMVAGQNLRKAAIADVNARLRVLSRVAATLDLLHAKGLAHGDIKPENIVLKPDETPVLVDFSAARFQMKRDRQNAATPAYLPTGWRAKFMTPRHRDQYAFGLLLLEAVTGTDHTHRTAGNTNIRILMKKAEPRVQTALKPLLEPVPLSTPKPLQERMQPLLKA